MASRAWVIRELWVQDESAGFTGFGRGFIVRYLGKEETGPSPEWWVRSMALLWFTDSCHRLCSSLKDFTSRLAEMRAGVPIRFCDSYRDLDPCPEPTSRNLLVVENKNKDLELRAEAHMFEGLSAEQKQGIIRDCDAVHLLLWCSVLGNSLRLLSKSKVYTVNLWDSKPVPDGVRQLKPLHKESP